MLDLSQFEGYNIPCNAEDMLLTECRRLQENNRELVEFIRESKINFDDMPGGWRFYKTIDDLITKNKE